MKKVAIAMVLCLLVTGFGAGCSETPEKVDIETTSGTDTTGAVTSAHSNIPEGLDFGGKTFTMACSDFNEYHYSIVEEQNGETLNDAKYKMTIETETKLNVDIVEVPLEVHSMAKTIINNVLAGDSAYDAVTHLDRFTVEMMLGGALTPLDEAGYIDLSAPYWNPQITDMLSIGDEAYYALGSYNMLTMVYTSCLYFNKAMLAELGRDSSDIYSAVESGDWTYDMMLGYMRLATRDVNGDTKMDENDRYGLCVYDAICFGNSILGSCDAFALGKSGDDELELLWGDEKFNEVMELTYNIYNNGDMWHKSERYSSDMFTSGNALFMGGYFYAVSTLSEMSDDYGIIPPPKYDASQNDYYCETYDAMYTSIPRSASDLNFSGAVLEELSFNGANNIIDAYIESTMKYKKSRDEESIKMIQLCLDSRVIDLSSIYSCDIAGYSSLYGGILNKPSYTFVSYAESNRAAVEKRLDDIYEAVNSHNS